MIRGWRGPWGAAIAVLALAGAQAAAPAAAPAAATGPTIVVEITSGPEGIIDTTDVSFGFAVEGTEEPGTQFHCGLDTPEKQAACSSPYSAGPLAPGRHVFYVDATDKAGYSQLVSRAFTIAAGATANQGAPTTGSGGAGSGGGVSVPQLQKQPAPLVSRLSESARTWREGGALARVSRTAAKPPQGTTFSFALSEAATLHLAFTKAASGRSVAGRCVAQTAHNRGKRACTRTTSAGTLTLAGRSGSDRVRFEGRVSATRKLAPGRYTLTLTATAGGLTSTPRSLTFTIVG
jgi:hypothetical protein